MEILQEIEAFIEARSMSPTRFGLLALNDKGLVFDLRGKRELLPRTEKKIRNFMLTYTDEA